jgi:FixJ family two-component response regulator
MGDWNQHAPAQESDPLTPRELEILALLAVGNTTPDIARQLGVSGRGLARIRRLGRASTAGGSRAGSLIVKAFATLAHVRSPG